MNQDDIIKMARKVGNVEQSAGSSDKVFWVFEESELVLFSNLVAAAERERIIAANAPEIEKVNVYIKALEDAVAAEREACANLVEQAGVDGYGTLVAALLIRERGAP